MYINNIHICILDGCIRCIACSHIGELQWYISISIQEDILHHIEWLLFRVFNLEVLHQLKGERKAHL